MEPTDVAIPTRREDALRARSESLAHRMLSGAGRASLVAYNLSPGVEASALCHGLSKDGELMVACVADDQVPVTAWGSVPLRVRLDIIKEAPEWSVRITSCAVHLLGVLEWLPEDVKDGYLADAGLHPRMVELASVPGGRLGIVRTERVLLHDSSGVTPLAFDELVELGGAGVARRQNRFPDLDQEWAARELLGRLSPADTADLLAAADSGWDAAIPLSDGDTGGCGHLDGQVFCVDIDRTGLTLMGVESGLTAVTMFAFDQPADSIEELTHRVRQLLDSACRFSAVRS